MSQNKREELTDDMTLFLSEVYVDLQMVNERRELTKQENDILQRTAVLLSRANRERHAYETQQARPVYT